jgi:hypothetical protein
MTLLIKTFEAIYTFWMSGSLPLFKLINQKKDIEGKGRIVDNQ